MNIRSWLETKDIISKYLYPKPEPYSGFSVRPSIVGWQAFFPSSNNFLEPDVDTRINIYINCSRRLLRCD